VGDIVFLVDESGSVGDIQASLINNIFSITTELDAAGVDWRIGIGGFGSSGTNPRVVQSFTNDSTTVDAALMMLVSGGSNEQGLAAIIQATETDGAAYGGVRADAGYCVILLTDEDSDYTGAGAVSDRAAALAALTDGGAGFIGVVDADNSRGGSTNVNADYIDLLAGSVPGAIFEIDDYVTNPAATNAAIIQTCINEIIAPVSYTLDIKPTSCPNPIKIRGRGVLPAAIVGSDGTDVTEIDPTTLMLEGCKVIRYNYDDVTAPFTDGFSDPLSERDCTTAGPDGFLDLTLKFSKQCVYQNTGITGKRQVRTLSLSGQTYAGDAFTLEDVVRLMR